MIVTSHSLAWVNFYRRADWIPVLGQFTNLAVLFQKYLLIPRGKPDKIQMNHIYRYIKERSAVRSIIIIALPIAGNLIIAIVDLCKYLRYKSLEKQWKKCGTDYKDPFQQRTASQSEVMATPGGTTPITADNRRQDEIIALAKKGLPEAIVELSTQDADYPIEKLEQAAMFGYIPAVHAIAMYHYNGDNERPRNIRAAQKILGFIASQDNPDHSSEIFESQYLYAKLLIHSSSVTRGIELLTKLIENPASEGDPHRYYAYLTLADLYAHGNGCAKDSPKAIALLRKAVQSPQQETDDAEVADPFILDDGTNVQLPNARITLLENGLSIEPPKDGRQETLKTIGGKGFVKIKGKGTEQPKLQPGSVQVMSQDYVKQVNEQSKSATSN